MKDRKGDKKAALEAAAFENFLHLGKIAFDRHEPGCPPEPDIIAWRGELQFGIEITAFHRQTQKTRAGELDHTIAKALEIYRSRGGPNTLLTVVWAPHFVPQKTERRRLAERIADFVISHAPPPGEPLTFDWRHFDREMMLEIAYIFLDGRPADLPIHWSTGETGSVPSWDCDQMQQKIDVKKEMPKGYAVSYKEIWLLIVSEFGSPSSWMEVTDAVRSAKFISPFQRVFLLSSFPLEVIELNSVQSLA